MNIFQTLAILFALFMQYVIYLHYKRKNLSRIEASGWSSLWVLFIILSIFPQLLTGISRLISFERVFDVLVVAGMMVITVVVFMTYFGQKATARKFENVIRKMALDEKKSQSNN